MLSNILYLRSQDPVHPLVSCRFVFKILLIDDIKPPVLITLK
jgi:hypothetical protein